MEKKVMSTLRDSKDNIEYDWKGKKLRSLELLDSYKRLDPDMKLFRSKIERLSSCSSYLEFKQFSDQTLKLHKANFCKIRLCPMCSWRRSRKIFSQVSQCMDHFFGYDFLFLTLTIKNVGPDRLDRSIDDLFYSFKKMMQLKRVSKYVKGFFRALEITYNRTDESFHPHIHAILLVKHDYFREGYISQALWTDLWKSSSRLDYTPIVHIQRFKGNVKKAVCEASKYTVKDSDYLFSDPDLTDTLVFILDRVLACRRLVAFGGVFKEIHSQLALDDAVDGDLVQAGDDPLRDDLNYILVRYNWNIGLSNYVLDSQ